MIKNTNSLVRVGVVGLGSFGEQHLAAFSKLRDVEIVGVADINPKRCQAVADRYRVSGYGTCSELLSACEPDAVSIVTPGHTHVHDTVAALESGCSVMLEKPVAVSAADVNTLMSAEAANDGFIMPGHISRFARPYATLRAGLADGQLGRILALHAERHRDRGHEDRYWHTHPVFMTMVHDIDLALWLTRADPVRAVAYERRASDGPQPSVLHALVETVDGGHWSLSTSWLLPEGRALPDRFEVFGSEGVATVAPGLSVSIDSRSARGMEALTPDALESALDAEVRHFCDCVRAGSESSVVTLADAARGVRLAEAIVGSAQRCGVAVEVG